MSNDWVNSGGFYPVATTATPGTWWVSPNVSVGSQPMPPMQVGGSPTVPEDEMAWLQRRVNEITGLVAA